MAGFALVLSESRHTTLGQAIYVAIRQPRPGERAVNQSTYGPLTLRPLGVSIAARTCADAAEGWARLALWTAAGLTHMRAWQSSLLRPPIPGMPTALPVVLVTEHIWRLSFVCDRGDRFEFLHELVVGNTASLIGVYKLLAVLRVLTRWMDTELRGFCHRLFGLDYMDRCCLAH